MNIPLTLFRLFFIFATLRRSSALKARRQTSLGQRPRTLSNNGAGLKARSNPCPGRWIGPTALSSSNAGVLGRCPRLVWGRAFGPENPCKDERKPLFRSFLSACGIALLLSTVISPTALFAATKPVPTKADVSYGPHPHQLMDIYVPKEGAGPFPVILWYGGIWASNKNVPDLNQFHPHGVAVISVQTRGMGDATAVGINPPISVVLLDARRSLQFVRMHASEWKIDPARIGVAGGSQAAIPSLYVACAGEMADSHSADPLERVSTKVVCAGSWRGPGSIDPKRLLEWVPGDEWGAPSLGCSFAESLRRRDELLPFINRWSPEALMTKNTPPIYVEYDWGLTKPDSVKEMDYKIHSPMLALGFQKMAQVQGIACYVRFPGHPSEKYNNLWDFLVKELTQPAK